MFRPTHFVLGAIIVTALATSSIAAQAPYSPDRASEYYFFTPAVFGAVPSPVVEANKAGFEKFEKMSSKFPTSTSTSASSSPTPARTGSSRRGASRAHIAGSAPDRHPTEGHQA
jgi:hypothetical protein